MQSNTQQILDNIELYVSTLIGRLNAASNLQFQTAAMLRDEERLIMETIIRLARIRHNHIDGCNSYMLIINLLRELFKECPHECLNITDKMYNINIVSYVASEIIEMYKNLHIEFERETKLLDILNNG